MNGTKQRLYVAAGLLTATLAAGAVVAQSGAAAPEARYVMDVGTIAGMMGRGDSHELTLRLGSRLTPTGGPAKADHFMPEVARLGASVPLVTPTPGPSGVREYDPQTDNFQKPKGRLLIYWGCGAKAGPGQPVVVDFSKLAKGQVPPNLYSTSVPTETGPNQGNSRTFGTWPNAEKSKQVSERSSLVGQHRIAGNYSPEIAFALNQDFMAGLRPRTAAGAGGATELSWGGIGAATGYYAWVMGGKNMGQDQGGDMVWWSSSATKEFGGGLWDWLSPATVNRLAGQKVVMPPSQTSCTIPAEVKQAAGEMMMGFLYAYGPEANFAYPERPADPKVAWRPKWTAKVRYRSMANFMTGMPNMGDILSGRDTGEEGEQPQGEQPKKKCKRGLGGMLRSAVGAGC
jgi:hypothetical protein